MGGSLKCMLKEGGGPIIRGFYKSDVVSAHPGNEAKERRACSIVIPCDGCHLLPGECCSWTSRIIQECLDTFCGRNSRHEEAGNSHDRHAVAVVRDSCVVSLTSTVF